MERDTTSQTRFGQKWQYKLVHVNLDSKPRYAALSYTWGDTYSPEPIILNDGPFWIIKNLRDAFHRLQKHEKAGYIWVDAVCINQQDDEEKGRQICKMRMIYEEANAVLVWLGHPVNEENARLAAEKIQHFDEMRKTHLLKNVSSGPSWLPRTPARQENLFSSLMAQISLKDKSVYDGAGSQTYRAWQGISELLTSSWWTRTWVCQEATVQEDRHFLVRNNTVIPPSAKIEFMYGAFATTWSSLINAADIGDHLETLRGVDMSFMGAAQDTFRRMMSILADRCQGQERDLVDMMECFRNSCCQNSRDRLYAPLCLTSSSSRDFIQPDYSKSVLEVYLDVARYYLTQKKLDFFGFVAGIHKSQYQPGAEEWPSWPPDWKQCRGFRQFGTALYVQAEPKMAIRKIHYSGNLDFTGTTSKLYNATADSTVAACLVGLKLEVQGFFCDIITEIIPFQVVGGRDAMQQALELWDASGNAVYLTGESIPTTLNRIQAADVEYDFYERISRRGSGIDFNLLKRPRSQVKEEHMEAWQTAYRTLLYGISGRSLCRTSQGYLGLVPEGAEIRDIVYALLGCQTLYTLRKEGDSRQEFGYIGECYLHGLMDGEAMRWLVDGSVKVESVHLVQIGQEHVLIGKK